MMMTDAQILRKLRSEPRQVTRLREKYLAEMRRGLAEEQEAIATLCRMWPAAFPKQPGRIRPLGLGIIPRIRAATGWSRAYTRGVLTAWRSRGGYCEAVLRYERRYDLTGVETRQTVDVWARAKARKRLALLAARRAM